MSNIKISAAIATFNEEDNLSDCLKSIKSLVNEIIVVDGSSTDKTVEIAKSFRAKVIITDNPPIFHINKQKAIDKSEGEWILQLDADERVTTKLAEEIKKIVNLENEEIDIYEKNLQNRKLFLKHQEIIEKRDGELGNPQEAFTAFFIPRLNFFLGRYLRYGGVYPDGVIRLFKKNRAFLPCKDVHEQYIVDGRVGWLQNDLLHLADPTFARYLTRNSRYINLIVSELERDHVGKSLKEFVNYILLKPIVWFLWTQIRHKGILDGIPGIVFSFFSALRFPRAYIKYFFNLKVRIEN